MVPPYFLRFLSTNIWVNLVIPWSHAKELLEIISAHKNTGVCTQGTAISCAREASWCWVSDLYLNMHRIRFQLENPLRPSSPTINPAQLSPPRARTLSTTFTCYLNNSQCGDSTTALHSLFECLTILSEKIFSLISNQNLSWTQLETISSCHIVHYLEEKITSHLREWEGCPDPPFLPAKKPLQEDSAIKHRSGE